MNDEFGTTVLNLERTRQILERFIDEEVLSKGHAQNLLAQLQTIKRQLEKENKAPVVILLHSFIKRVFTFFERGILSFDESTLLVNTVQNRFAINLKTS